jgi:hypothetical protein
MKCHIRGETVTSHILSLEQSGATVLNSSTTIVYEPIYLAVQPNRQIIIKVVTC